MREPKSLNMDIHTVIDCVLSDVSKMTGIDLTVDRAKIRKCTRKWILTCLDAQLKLLRRHLQNRNSGLSVPSSNTIDLATDYPFAKVKVDVIIASTDCVHVQTKIPTFLSPLWRRWIVGDCDECFAALYQVVSTTQKWFEPNAVAPTMLEAYDAQQATMKSIIDVEIDDVIAEVDRLIPTDLPPDPTSLYPVYGPEGAGYNHIRPIDRLGLVPSNLKGLLAGYREHPLWVQPVDVGAVNRAAQVPKTWNKDRLIFVEEEARLNVQQALRVWLEDTTSAVKPKRFDFKDQEFQRASLSRDSVASIDLSAASDTISSALVFKLLRNRPRLRALLFSARARRHSNGSLHRCFSTMGNATTFPVMTIVLSAIVAAEERAFNTDFGWTPRTSPIRKGTVFGDDMVVDQMIMPRLILRLRQLGMKPNTAKTYNGSSFKESCGLDLYKGSDVTPLRVTNLTDLTFAESMVRLVDVSNRAHRRGLWTLAEYIKNIVLKHRRIPTCSHERHIPGAFWSFSCDQGLVRLPGFAWDDEFQTSYVPIARSGITQKVDEKDSVEHLQYFLRTGKRLVQVSDASEASRIARQSRDSRPFGRLAGKEGGFLKRNANP